MTDKTYKISEGQRIMLCEGLKLMHEAGVKPIFAPEFCELSDLFKEPHVDEPLAWDDPRFTDEDKNQIIGMLEEEICDCSKDLAFEQAAGESMVDLIGYCDRDADAITHVLQHLAGQLETGHVNGEFLRLHDEEDEYAECLDFAKRMGLITDDEDAPTSLGLEYIERFR